MKNTYFRVDFIEELDINGIALLVWTGLPTVKMNKYNHSKVMRLFLNT